MKQLNGFCDAKYFYFYFLIYNQTHLRYSRKNINKQMNLNYKSISCNLFNENYSFALIYMEFTYFIKLFWIFFFILSKRFTFKSTYKCYCSLQLMEWI